MTSRFEIQESEYAFPYHHIPHFDETGVPSRFRVLSWGIEYLCYLAHVRDLVLGLSPESVLEVGCGDGRFVGMLPGTIRRRVGVDL